MQSWAELFLHGLIYLCCGGGRVVVAVWAWWWCMGCWWGAYPSPVVVGAREGEAYTVFPVLRALYCLPVFEFRRGRRERTESCGLFYSRSHGNGSGLLGRRSGLFGAVGRAQAHARC